MAISGRNSRLTGLPDGALILGFASLLAVFVASALVAYFNSRAVLGDSSWLEHSHMVLQVSADTNEALTEAESAARSFYLTGREDSYEEFASSCAEATASFDRLVTITKDSPSQQLELEELRPILFARLKDLRTTSANRRRGGLAAVLHNPQVSQILAVRRNMKEALDRFRKREMNEMQRRRVHAARAVEVASTSFWTSSVLGVLALVGFFAMATRSLAAEKRARAVEAARAQELDEQIRFRTAELMEANENLESFSYSVSHDLRAPLRAISGFAAIVGRDLEGQIPSHDQEMLDKIRASCRRMSDLIDAILGLSRLSRAEPSVRTVDAAEMATDVLAELHADNLNVQIQPKMAVSADPSLLRILLVNLLGNAVKFSSKKENPQISFGLRKGADWRVLYVKDNGAGFDSTHARNVFEPFQRFHTQAEFGGTGIGLAICQKIVRRHGGRIWIDSVPSEGTTVFFSLWPVPDNALEETMSRLPGEAIPRML